MNQLAKWLRYYHPLFQGRFDFARATAQPQREAWHQGLAMTCGRFWARIRGGHDLRRRDIESGNPASILVGRSDGPSDAVTTFPWVGHASGQEYAYALTVGGAGGVTDEQNSPELRLTFDDDGDLLGPSPNAVSALAADAVSDGRFRLRWTYDETSEEASPAAFHVFNDAGSPGTIDYENAVASVPYRRRRGYFHWTSEGFAHDVRVTWAVRAVSDQGVSSIVSSSADGVARANLPPAPTGIRVHRGKGC